MSSRFSRWTDQTESRTPTVPAPSFRGKGVQTVNVRLRNQLPWQATRQAAQCPPKREIDPQPRRSGEPAGRQCHVVRAIVEASLQPCRQSRHLGDQIIRRHAFGGVEGPRRLLVKSMTVPQRIRCWTRESKRSGQYARVGGASTRFGTSVRPDPFLPCTRSSNSFASASTKSNTSSPFPCSK